ncbi:AAA family ATPase [Lacticaseibacillus rhamnosus]|uniref:AAA family ATPase n=1 Tax=Lacticaseibacillus rhamnosus TaxID=47715 RepID=UPI00237F7A98|nr:AAA family ATPase [Lacticaseibacillus rhamnosus]MDE3295714.1 AAA family ATPase [Lacticaseibacillus rhamnosus]
MDKTIETLALTPLDQWADENKENDIIRKYIRQEKRKPLRYSLYADQTVRDDTFDNFECDTAARQNVYSRALVFLKRIIDGEKFNGVLGGSAGTGKTHLAMSILNALQQRVSMDNYPVYSAMFISAPLLMDWELQKARGDKEFIAKANDKERQIKDADVIVFDDFGSETSMRHQVIEASDFIQKTWFRIADSRVNKVNLFTTNNSLKELRHIYNEKLISRFMTKDTENFIAFSGIDDRRLK